ncbi:MAG: hypothetical protein JNJ57_11420 [Saprospiraceae bacterium]|nr:hypothetical protein [Saprospiraceae bacterium]
MKKVLFLSAFVGLIGVSAIFYACQKDAPEQLKESQLETVKADDRNASPCPNLIIGRGVGLIVCGIDNGSDCEVCGNSSKSAVLTQVGHNFPFANSNHFSLYNPTGAAIRCAVSFNCANVSPQWFTINPGQTVSFTVNPVNGCCLATPGCY